MIPHLPEKDAYTLVETAEHFDVPVDTVLSWARRRLINCCVLLPKQKVWSSHPHRKTGLTEYPDWIRGGYYRIPTETVIAIMATGSGRLSMVFNEGPDEEVIQTTIFYLDQGVELIKDRLLISRSEMNRFQQTWSGEPAQPITEGLQDIIPPTSLTLRKRKPIQRKNAALVCIHAAIDALEEINKRTPTYIEVWSYLKANQDATGNVTRIEGHDILLRDDRRLSLNTNFRKKYERCFY